MARPQVPQRVQLPRAGLARVGLQRLANDDNARVGRVGCGEDTQRVGRVCVGRKEGVRERWRREDRDK